MDTKRLHHSHDPFTSADAAVRLNVNDTRRLKDALLILLHERPRTGDELTSAYVHRAVQEQWPILSDTHNVKRRLSDLHARHHVIRTNGDTRASRMGKKASVWELAVPLEEARLIVGAS